MTDDERSESETPHITPYTIEAEVVFQVPAYNAAEAVKKLKSFERETKENIGGILFNIENIKKRQKD